MIAGTVRLSLGERQVMVQASEAAEVSTTTPHVLAAPLLPGRRSSALPVLPGAAPQRSRASRRKAVGGGPARRSWIAAAAWWGRTVEVSISRS